MGPLRGEGRQLVAPSPSAAGECQPWALLRRDPEETEKEEQATAEEAVSKEELWVNRLLHLRLAAIQREPAARRSQAEIAGALCACSEVPAWSPSARTPTQGCSPRCCGHPVGRNPHQEVAGAPAHSRTENGNNANKFGRK